ncbi:MAG: SDR family NAD(P)-dependent oxidoreductase [Pseudomonadota bacterium]
MAETEIKRALVMGATGGIGSAFVSHLLKRDGLERLHCCSRSGAAPIEDDRIVTHEVDYDAPTTIKALAETVKDEALDLVIVATGMLHEGDDLGPEKALKALNAENMQRVFHINTFGPALMMKALLPAMNREGRSVFAALSARVGSISDNGIGGWYSYRSAKAALNQMLKTVSIEHARRWPDGVVVGLHPGTVDTGLSQPFQRNVADGKLFTPAYASGAMLDVLDGLTSADTGKVFAYDGQEIPA